MTLRDHPDVTWSCLRPEYLTRLHIGYRVLYSSEFRVRSLYITVQSCPFSGMSLTPHALRIIDMGGLSVRFRPCDVHRSEI